VGFDNGHASDRFGVGVQAPLTDRAVGTTIWTIDRWDAEAAAWAAARLETEGLHRQPTKVDFDRLRIASYKTSEVVGNLVCTAGWTRASNLLTNQGATQAMDATHTRIGVGNGAGTAAAGDTDLSASAGSTNRWFQLVTAAGTVSTNTLAFSATFASADGNFAWNEFGIDVGNTASSAVVASLLYNHKTSIAQGTKASGQVWTATATLTYT
jgi:hypothetical protein